jgi:methionine-rich copper-binding protein CopC
MSPTDRQAVVVRRLRAVIVTALCASTMALAAPQGALAHARLVKSEPARRAALTRPPARVRLWFNERLEPAFCRATLAETGGKSVETAPATVSADDPKRLDVNVPVLAPGEYVVSYEVLSVDGHTVRSSFTFKIRPGATAP